MIKQLKLWWCEWHYWKAERSVFGLRQIIADGVEEDEEFIQLSIKWHEAVASDYKEKIKDLKKGGK